MGNLQPYSRTKLLAVVATLLGSFLFGIVPAHAFANPVFNGIVYQQSDSWDNNWAAAGCSGTCPENLVISNYQSEGRYSTSLVMSHAFSFKGLKSVTFPVTMRSLRWSSFRNNNLESLTLPPGIQVIMDNAFANNKLTSLDVPASLNSLEYDAFSYNQLTNVRFFGNAPSTNGNPFVGNVNLQAIHVRTGATGWGSDFYGIPVIRDASPPVPTFGGHFYSLVQTLSSWPEALSGAESSTYQGVSGHLVTINSREENDFLTWTFGGSSSAYWIAAKDTGPRNGTTRSWTWRSGPDLGQLITACNDYFSATSCSASAGTFSNWESGEPNNAGGTEIYAHLKGNGLWNDCSTSCGLYPYIVEFEGLPPTAPQILDVGSSNMRANVYFASPSDNGGASITNYEYSTDGGTSWTAASPAQITSPLEIIGLTNGSLYSVKLRAVNSIGSGAASNAVLVTPRYTSSAPTISSVSLNSLQANVEFSAPSSDGGANITNYEYSIDGGTTWLAAAPAQTSSPLIISGLTNGTSYSVKVRAVNSVGSGAESNAVSVKPVAPASAPTISGVVAGNGQATLSITAPSQINDSSLSGYDYSTNNGSTWSHFASVTGPFTISGLTNATAYQVKVRAVNSAGAGEASAAVTVNPTRLIPARPVIASIVGGNTSATVNITNPTDVTAQSITGYQYSIDKGATYQNAAVSNGSFTISGLTNGVSTSVQIRATNFNGTSLASVAKSVIPSTTPAAPGITTITPTTGALSITFTAPNTGGSAITGYQYSLDGGLTWVVPKTAVKSSPIRVTGLPNATNYQVSIRAVNAKGTGTASAVVSATTPVLVPTAPVITSISKSRTTITMDFNAPVNNGGGTITNYAYSTDSGRSWVLVSPASNSTRVVITGLNPSTLYPVQIAAINSAGRGASSALTRVGTLH